MTKAEQRLEDAKAAKERALILCNAVWEETDRQRHEALYAYDAVTVKFYAALNAVAEES